MFPIVHTEQLMVQFLDENHRGVTIRCSEDSIYNNGVQNISYWYQSQKIRFQLLHCIDRDILANVEISSIWLWPFWRGLNMLRASRCHRWHHCSFTFDFYWMLLPLYMDPIETPHAINNQSMIRNWLLVSRKNTSNNAVIELHVIAYMKTNSGGTQDEIK